MKNSDRSEIHKALFEYKKEQFREMVSDIDKNISVVNTAMGFILIYVGLISNTLLNDTLPISLKYLLFVLFVLLNIFWLKINLYTTKIVGVNAYSAAQRETTYKKEFFSPYKYWYWLNGKLDIHLKNTQQEMEELFRLRNSFLIISFSFAICIFISYFY